ncbi:MAG: hypothetical protein MZV49_16070 [Rhodopseudomonas palustris]|nr:hypothetical protein [Rhodopseudomonas palustris]
MIAHLRIAAQPYYRPVGQRGRPVRGRLRGAHADDAQRPDRLRQDALRRVHGLEARASR